MPSLTAPRRRGYEAARGRRPREGLERRQGRRRHRVRRGRANRNGARLPRSSCWWLGVSPRRSAEGQGALTKAQGRRTSDGPPPSLFHARNLGWLKMKNPEAPAVKREAEEDWGR